MSRPANRDRIRTLLKGIETGDPESVVAVDEAKYVQHNPMTEAIPPRSEWNNDNGKF